MSNETSRSDMRSFVMKIIKSTGHYIGKGRIDNITEILLKYDLDEIMNRDDMLLLFAHNLAILKSHLVYNSLYKEIQNLNDEADFFIYDYSHKLKIIFENLDKEFFKEDISDCFKMITYEEKILKIHNFEKEKNKLKEKIEESYQGLLLEYTELENYFPILKNDSSKYSCCYESYERFLIGDKNSLLDILNDLSESRDNAFYSSDEKCYELKEKIQKWKKEKAKEVEHGNKEN